MSSSGKPAPPATRAASTGRPAPPRCVGEKVRAAGEARPLASLSVAFALSVLRLGCAQPCRMRHVHERAGQGRDHCCRLVHRGVYHHRHGIQAVGGTAVDVCVCVDRFCCIFLCPAHADPTPPPGHAALFRAPRAGNSCRSSTRSAASSAAPRRSRRGPSACPRSARLIPCGIHDPTRSSAAPYSDVGNGDDDDHVAGIVPHVRYAAAVPRWRCLAQWCFIYQKRAQQRLLLSRCPFSSLLDPGHRARRRGRSRQAASPPPPPLTTETRSTTFRRTTTTRPCWTHSRSGHGAPARRSPLSPPRFRLAGPVVLWALLLRHPTLAPRPHSTPAPPPLSCKTNAEMECACMGDGVCMHGAERSVAAVVCCSSGMNMLLWIFSGLFSPSWPWT